MPHFTGTKKLIPMAKVDGRAVRTIERKGTPEDREALSAAIAGQRMWIEADRSVTNRAETRLRMVEIADRIKSRRTGR